MKTGRLSREEWIFIEENCEKYAPEEIARRLDRDIDPIIKYLRRIGKSQNKTQALVVQAEYDLKSRPYWKELKLQFSEDELELFLHHWKEIVAQFRKDVMKTEELQIVDTIKLEILMNRALREQRESEIRVKSLEQEMNVLKTRPMAEQDREQIFSIERQIASMRAAKESLSREYKDLYSKKESAFKNLKATREQRIQKLENNKTTLAGLIDKILRDPEFFEEQGKYLEKMRFAMENEKARLSDYHKYDDGTLDQPLLNSDTVFITEQ